MTKVPRPTHITVMGRKFKITQPDKVDENDSLGDSQVSDKLIQIRKGQSDLEFETVLLHEVIHMALGVSGNSEDMPEGMEERIVLCLEYALIELYQRIKK